MNNARARELRQRLVELYTSSWKDAFYTRVKLLLLPLGEVAERLPKQGVLLDMGCGFGYVANYLSIDSPDRVIVANDPAASRIAAARKTLGTRRNIEFHALDSRQITRSDFDGASVFDVLHHVPYAEQQSLIDDLYRKLKPGGVLVIRETDQRPALRYYLFNCALEWLLYVGQEKTRFRPMRDWSAMLEQAGFRIEAVTPNEWWYPYTTCLFVCRKPLDG